MFWPTTSSGISIAFAGQDQLAPWAATSKRERKPGQHHTQEIPKVIAVGNRLCCKAGIKLT